MGKEYIKTHWAEMKIIEITNYTPAVKETVNHLLQQLVTDEIDISESFLDELVRSENSHLFCAVDESGNYSGMVTVGIYLSPTGAKAWVEDVVVDQSQRGKGIGELLTKHAVAFAKEKKVHVLMLTSNPSRVAANALYQKMGFVRKETNMYRMFLQEN